MFERLRRIPSLWFTLATPVGGLEYAVSGFLLAPVKFLLDRFVYGLMTADAWTWTRYFEPFLDGRIGPVNEHNRWGIWVIALLTVPFLWIGVSMTVRRCLDGGLSPWISLLFFVPIVNYFLMLALCLVPSRRANTRPLRRAGTQGTYPSPLEALRAAAAGTVIGLTMVLASVLALNRYGLALFVGAPFAMGAVSAFVLNRSRPRRFAATFGITQLALLAAALALVLFALEGVVCLAMVYPIAMSLALLGGLLGQALAAGRPAPVTPLLALLCGLPLLLAADLGSPGPPLRQVTTGIEIDASPAEVWSAVIDFPDLPPPAELMFRGGIAYPVRARIEGSGVGAVRYCEFSTGAFVEPITAWEPPRRLAFDVSDQPLPMIELSPYGRIHAPHLLHAMVSRRGEFLLIPRPGGGTRLEGRTWYTLDLWPQAYWSPWSDAIVHRIHRRVLEHVRDVAEASAG